MRYISFNHWSRRISAEIPFRADMYFLFLWSVRQLLGSVCGQQWSSGFWVSSLRWLVWPVAYIFQKMWSPECVSVSFWEQPAGSFCIDKRKQQKRVIFVIFTDDRYHSLLCRRQITANAVYLRKLSALFACHFLLLTLDHLANHLATNGTVLLRSKLTVVTVLQRYA